MRSRALTISVALAAFAGCQVVGGIEERPYVSDAGASVTSDAQTPDASSDAPSLAPGCAKGTCFHEIGAGASFTCMRDAKYGQVSCSGENERGQIGNNSTDDQKDPVFVFGLDGATDVWAGVDHACALLADGRVSCWGSNVSGELGDRDFHAYYRARAGLVRADFTPLSGVRQLALGDGHTCALTDANVLCWGANSYGQVAKGIEPTLTEPKAVSGLRSGGDDDTIGIAAGGWTTCALKYDGAVMCWGYNGAGQLANGSRLADDDPTFIQGLPAARHVAMSRERVCAVARDGAVWCWGGASDADAGPPPAPAAVAGVTHAVEVAVGDEHTCAKIDDGTVICWGYDLHGQLGRGRNDGGAPGLVPSLPNVTSLAVGPSHSCAKSAGTFYCWGFNDKGQLGDGSTTDQYVPTKVLSP